MNRELLSKVGTPRAPAEKASELEVMMALTEREENFYKQLKEKYNIVIEQCRNCWTIGKHITQKCCHDKPVCPRCGADETHARETCFVMCFRCGEVGAQAFHESCPKRRVEILKHALMKKYDLDHKRARDVARGKISIADAVKQGACSGGTSN